MIPGSRRSPEEGNGYLLPYSCLEKPMDRGAWKGYSPRDHKESFATKELTLSPLSHFFIEFKFISLIRM